MDSNITCGPQTLSTSETLARQTLLDSLQLIPPNEILLNLGLFADTRMLSKILFLNHVYQKITHLQGVVMDLGTRWGQNAVIMQTLRAIYEPYNYQRKILAFDTFTGFVGNSEHDGDLANGQGLAAVTDNYQQHLDSIMQAHEQLHPLNHMKKFEIVAGDVRQTVERYLSQNPETLISLAFFDLDIYEPTKKVLEDIMPRLGKGSILVFDQLNYKGTPGETRAVLECLNINQHEIRRFPYCSRISYVEF